MKETSAILINYTDQSVLDKALSSLKAVSSHLHSIIVLHEKNTAIQPVIDSYLFPKTEFHSFKTKQMGKTLNEIISQMNSKFVLFLHQSDYLSSNANSDAFEIKPSQAVLVQTYRHKQTTIHMPLLVRTSLLQKHPFLSEHCLPFKEAFFPAWLSAIDDDLKVFKKNLVKHAKKNTTADWLEKQKFAEKYQFEKGRKRQHPSLSIFITNYNMEKYVETAIASCLLQNEQAEQICIMDDGSTDNSCKQINNWRDKQGIHIFHKQNGGKARALNDLLAHVTSDFILELDADDWLDPDTIFIIKNHLENLPEDVAVLYGNLRRWKQLQDHILFKKQAMGRQVSGRRNLLSYHFPLGPRIYRTSSLKTAGGFPIISFQDGRLYEDVSVLNRLITSYRFQYENFTVYNIREHKESITKKNLEHWNEFIKKL